MLNLTEKGKQCLQGFKCNNGRLVLIHFSGNYAAWCKENNIEFNAESFKTFCNLVFGEKSNDLNVFTVQENINYFQ